MELRNRRFGIWLDVKQSTASLAVGIHGYTLVTLSPCCSQAQKKMRAVHFSGRFLYHKTTKPDELHQTLSATCSMSYVKRNTTTPSTPMLFTWFLWHASGPEVIPGKECLFECSEDPSQKSVLKMDTCDFSWKSRTIKLLSLRENPASLIPQEPLSLHGFFPQRRKWLCSPFPSIHCSRYGFSQAIL